MIVILSPSKNMDMKPARETEHSQPEFLNQSEQLIKTLRTFSIQDLMQFMSISEKLAELNSRRITNWSRPFSCTNAKQALLAFTGNVYDGLAADSLTAGDLQFAQSHLRILSGLYGLLRPTDLMQPYRLEMGRPLQTGDKKNLYEFWSNTITAALNQLPGEILVNLASLEYFKVIAPKKLNKQILSPVFKDEKNGTFKIISVYAKKARGAMARFIIENRITTTDRLLTFQADGYRHSPEQSTEQAPAFTR